jgi:GNAT superfamily N-acetyltransferase
VLARSLALTTDLGLLALRGARIVDRGDYLVVETPTDHGFYFGNLLCLPAAPQVGEVAYWMRKFADELGHLHDIHHVTFQWDDPTGATGATDELASAGFEVAVHDVMTATSLSAPRPTNLAGLELRALEPDDLDATAEIGWTIGDRHDDNYRTFLWRRADWQAQLVDRGDARFWGVFDGELLVASLGLAPVAGVRRFQDVQTIAQYRGRGLASALLVAAAADAPAAGPLVIVTEHGSAAARLYTSCGFAVAERVGSACRHPYL